MLIAAVVIAAATAEAAPSDQIVVFTIDLAP
jgi:hypothetical protein